MLILILSLSLILGSLFVYISRFNFQPVSVNLGLHIFQDVPLFYVIIGSLLVGLVLSNLVYLVHSISNSFVLREKDNEIKKNKNEILELTKRAHQLEIKNDKLGNDSHIEPIDRNAL